MRINLHHLAPLAAILLSLSGSTVVAAEEAGFPLEISHALGQTTVPEKPHRVATVAWANHEVPLALGIVPVGMAAANFGDDDGDGLLPWVSERLKSLGADAPVLFDEGDGIDFEAVAGTAPDVILAAYSGLSQSDYDTLSQIAPVIAYPQAPWSTDWRETIRFDSAGMGMAPDGEALIADIEQKIAAEVAKYPELNGKRAMFVTHLDATDLSIVNFYTTQDTRVRFFADLGLSMPKSVMQASTTGSFAGSISAEQIDLFDDVDILVTYGDQALIEAMKANPLLSHMPAVKHDAIVTLGRDPLGTAANPTPLSITWVLPAYVEKLADAARKTE
ncbi:MULTISPECIES: iron-siderophore ABC transporter substrate-binding protein [unclassified Agrobacterium]|uniref:iron-siderophore ABC transporter substrate-binding protein n=1 Tax=unclassified Agrobacterium TaxID=2632611 RepID=UPI00083D697F|nr:MULTISPECIES: iron-siderophore ABC transporter substrate-binding protein [unclassified Agrobacterium]AOG11927.1 periplasmic binding family protein [Agrobacterium sp. RAC06]QGG89307.1 ABC transporter substrate-binding protein [Agrobacterium sp. MA01]